MENTFAMEAIAETSILELPNFHILANRRDDGIMRGHCLDFDIWAFSEEKDDETALNQIFERLSDMVVIHILGHIQRSIVDHLYDNQIELTGEWGIFFKFSAKEKIKRLKDSYSELMNHPKKLMDEIGKLQINELFTFNNLTNSSQQSLREALTTLQGLNPEKAAEAIENILAITKRYTLRIAA